MDWLKLRANYTQGWRAPSGRQLFASSFYEDYGAPVRGRAGAGRDMVAITRMPDTVMNYGIRFNYPAWQFSGNLNFNYYGLQYGGRADVGLGPIPGFGRFTVANLSLRKRLLGGMNTNNLDLKLDANSVNWLANLTLDRRSILTPLRGVV